MLLPAPPASPSDLELWTRLKSMVLDALTSAHSKRSYGKALDEYRAWWDAQGRPPFSRPTVAAYKSWLGERGLAAASVNIRLSAIRKLAAEAAENGLLQPEVAAGIARLRGVSQRGVRTGNWLTIAQAQDLLRAPAGGTLKGVRDRAILALLLGCGLRRAELATTDVEHLQQRDGRWVLIDIRGKGGRLRTVPIPAWVKVAIDHWRAAAGIDCGRLFRSVEKGGRMGGMLAEKTVWRVLRTHCAAAGLPAIAPHDLRRTCAKLCRAGGGELEQIQFLLGHASIQTTERYLGGMQDLTHAPNDRIRLKI